MRRLPTPVLFLASLCLTGCGADLPSRSDGMLSLPAVGSTELKLLTPNTLELFLVSTKAPGSRPGIWDFVDARGRAKLPDTVQFRVTVDGKSVGVVQVGFKRRVIYAPFKKRDLRIGNWLYLVLATPVPEGATVEVNNPGNGLWRPEQKFVCRAEPLRWSPAIHVNQTGYMLSLPKRAFVGFFAGGLGELGLSAIVTPKGEAAPVFRVLDQTGQEVFRGNLKIRPDQGFPYRCYEHVLEADFSALKTPGEFRLHVPGLGTSFPFHIDDAVAGAFARANALGIFHQRCGTSNAMPFTRFTHAACHSAPAEVPTVSKRFASVNQSLAKESANFKDEPRHTAPQLKDVAASLYPFVNRGPVDVHGGHHDAGDYSKYTINSAGFIHHLVFAADVFPGVAELDNLGLPESGDGLSDILQEAKWEADFLARMQDADGGFYFLVYPRDREYEYDVLPDRGDPQIVFPKTTSVTAAATAALAQCASSPTFKKQFPEAAARYLKQAQAGWAFLERAFAKYGQDGAYQKITHYGDDFMHDDELAWAATELFIATGEGRFHDKVMDWLKPSDPATRKWGWWRLYDAYGCAIRSYAFAAKAGKLRRDQQNGLLREQCENEIAEAGADQLRRSRACAYGTSFPEETKRARAGGWYFSSDAAFDLAVASQLDYPEARDPRPELLDAIIANLNYEEGCNPVNVTYLTGLGWKRQREIVDQYAQNDRRVLPPTGIPLGNIQASFGWLDLYKGELTELSFPPDGDESAPYPLYDRWADSFNLTQEFVILNQARALGYTAWLMAKTTLKAQPWTATTGSISRSPTGFVLSAHDFDFRQARIVWEAQAMEPVIGFSSGTNLLEARGWLEAEAQLPDGRRVFIVTNAGTIR